MLLEVQSAVTLAFWGEHHWKRTSRVSKGLRSPGEASCWVWGLLHQCVWFVKPMLPDLRFFQREARGTHVLCELSRV